MEKIKKEADLTEEEVEVEIEKEKGAEKAEEEIDEKKKGIILYLKRQLKKLVNIVFNNRKTSN